MGIQGKFFKVKSWASFLDALFCYNNIQWLYLELLCYMHWNIGFVAIFIGYMSYGMENAIWLYQALGSNLYGYDII